MTEKNYNPEQRERKTMGKQETTHKMRELAERNQELKSETNTEQTEVKTKSPEKKPEQQKPKKSSAVINAFDIPISTKHSIAICRFIKKKGIQEAIRDLELVASIKKYVPMKGEIPHRHGKNAMAGRFPQKAAKEFIVLLKSLSSNSSYHGLENPIITETVANIGSRPFGRRGIRRKRTNIRIVAENKQNIAETK